MFTVKHTHADFSETIHSADDVRYTPRQIPTPDQTSEPAPETVWVSSGDITMPLTNGIVYVMNDHGSTVAKYDMRSPIQPQMGRS